MSIQLTTLVRVKEYARLQGTNHDARLKTIIAAVSDEVQLFCNRTFALTTYRSWLDGSGTSQMLLPQFPVRALMGVSFETVSVMTVKNTTATFATVSVMGGILTLWHIDTAGAETTTDITIASYQTISELAAQIVATGGGWTATAVTGETDSPSLLIKSTWGALALSPSYATLEIPGTADDSVELVPDSERLIRSFSGFPKGRSNVFAYYKAGYTLPTEQDVAGNLPDGLMLIVARIVMDVFNSGGQNGAYSSESIGDHSWTIDGSIARRAVISHAQELSPYRALYL
jgi:hypothetical protein